MKDRVTLQNIAFLASFGIKYFNSVPGLNSAYYKGRFQIRMDVEWFWRIVSQATDEVQAITIERANSFPRKEEPHVHVRIYYARKSDIDAVIKRVLELDPRIEIDSLKSSGHWERSFIKGGSTIGEIDSAEDKETNVYYEEVKSVKNVISQLKRKYKIKPDDEDGIISTQMLFEGESIEDQLPLAIAFLKYAGAKFEFEANDNPGRKSVPISDWRIEISRSILDANSELEDKVEAIFGDSLIMYDSLDPGDYCFITQQSAKLALQRLLENMPEFTVKTKRGIEREDSEELYYRDKYAGQLYIGKDGTNATLFLTKQEIVRLAKVIKEEMGIVGDDSVGLDATHSIMEEINFNL